MYSHADRARRMNSRLTCDLFFDGTRHSGVVLNISRSGLFVQTSVTAQPGANVAIDLNGPEGESLKVDATVVWKRAAEMQLMGRRPAGVGLRISPASPGYLDFLENINQRKPRSPATGSALKRYHMRVKFGEEPRTRALMVSAESQEAACSQALQEFGDGWSVIESREELLD